MGESAVASTWDASLELPALPQPSSRTDLVVDAMREAILKGDLKPGSQLVERELAQRLNVSKTPVREALKILSRSGLVDTRSYKGMTVRVVDAQMVRDSYGVRLLLEPAALRDSVPLLGDDQLTQLVTLLERAAGAAAAEDLVGLGGLNRQFHRQLYAGCGNPLLIDFLDNLQDQMALIALTGWTRDSSWGREAEQHRAILDSVTDGNAEEAQGLLADHISRSRDRVLAALGAAGV